MLQSKGAVTSLVETSVGSTTVAGNDRTEDLSPLMVERSFSREAGSAGGSGPNDCRRQQQIQAERSDEGIGRFITC